MLKIAKVPHARRFGLGGHGGFLAFTVPAGYRGALEVTGAVAYDQPNTNLEYRGAGSTGSIRFSDVRFAARNFSRCTSVFYAILVPAHLYF